MVISYPAILDGNPKNTPIIYIFGIWTVKVNEKK